MSKQTRQYTYHFRGAHAPPAVASREDAFCSLVVGTGGTPTVQALDGAMRLALTADDEVQRAALYMGDVLPFDVDDIQRVDIIARASAIGATEDVVFGVASARNNTLDNVAAHAWFRMDGSNALVCESDDGTTDVNDIATGVTPAAANYFHYGIDFASGIHSQDPPSLSLGRKSNLHFTASNSLGSHRRVATGSRFSLSQYSAGVQFLFELQKASGVGTPTFDILECSVDVKLPSFS